MNFETLLFWMLVGHALADYPLQGDFLAKGKNHKAPLPGVSWWVCLLAHAFIHAGAVALITRSTALGWCELVMHLVIDFGKCDGVFGFKVDQALHVVCKIAWALIVVLLAMKGTA
jgi:hypothetical protein